MSQPRASRFQSTSNGLLPINKAGSENAFEEEAGKYNPMSKDPQYEHPTQDSDDEYKAEKYVPMFSDPRYAHLVPDALKLDKEDSEEPHTPDEERGSDTEIGGKRGSGAEKGSDTERCKDGDGNGYEASDSDLSTNNAFTPRAKLGVQTLSPVAFHVIKRPPVLENLESFVSNLEPVDYLLAELDQNINGQEMIDILLQAEMALTRNEVDEAEEKTMKAMEMATNLGDQGYIDRCEIFLDWVREMREGTLGVKKMKREKNERKMEGRTAPRKQSQQRVRQQPRRGSDVDESFREDDSSRNSSPGADVGGELLGEVLGEKLYDPADEEAQWADGESADEGRRVVFQPEFSDDASWTDAEMEIDNELKHDRDHDHDGSEIEHEHDFEPRNRPETPIPPRSPTPDENEQEQAGAQRPSQTELNAERTSPEPQHTWDFLRLPSSASEPEDTYVDDDDDHDGVFYSSASTSASGPDGFFSDTDVDTDTEKPRLNLHLQKTRKRPLSPISSTTLSYTHIHKHKRALKTPHKRPHKNATNTKTQVTLPPAPKPWHHPTDITDVHSTFHTLFYNPHLPAILLTDPVEEDDTSWLGKYDSSPFPMQRSKFTFRQKMPMSEMASRVRRTKMFPEQIWEYIPKPRQWESFRREMEKEGKMLTMGFLDWERERVGKLVGEKNGDVFVGVHSDRERKGKRKVSGNIRRGYDWAPVSPGAFWTWFVTRWMFVGVGLILLFSVLLTVFFG